MGNKTKVLIITINLFLGFSMIVFGQTNKLDVNQVRQTIEELGDNIPLEIQDVAEGIDPLILYIDDYALAFFDYKSEGADVSTPQSLILIYKREKSEYIYQSNCPYYYNLELLSKEYGVLFSNNRKCDLAGRCNTYIEFAKFGVGELFPIASYNGFDNYLYYFGLRSQDDLEKYRKAIGSQIKKDISIDNINITNEEILQFTLNTETAVLISEDKEPIAKFDSNLDKVSIPIE